MALQPFVALVRFFSFLIYIQSVGLLGRVISPSQGLYLYTGQHKHRINVHKHPCLSRIRTYDPGVRASEDSSRLRQLGYRDRPSCRCTPRKNRPRYRMDRKLGGPGAGLNAVESRKILLLLGIESQPSSLWLFS
jgi:hypothetical protein